MNIRCTYSTKGVREFNRSRKVNFERRGYIVGVSRDGTCYAIKWDGNKSSTLYAKSFINILTEETDWEIE